MIIKKSPIAGKGLFASKRIRVGQRIGQYVGELISSAEASRRYPGYCAVRHRCLVWTLDGADAVIDAGRGGNYTRYLNHSFTPNVEGVQTKMQVHFYALQNIQPGVELTIDYTCQCSWCKRRRK